MQVLESVNHLKVPGLPVTSIECKFASDLPSAFDWEDTAAFLAGLA